MPLNLVRLGASGLLGLGNITTEIVDDKQGWVKPYENSSDWLRTGAFVGGAFLAYSSRAGMMSDIGEGLELGALPLAEQSVYKLIRTYLVKNLPVLPASNRGYTLRNTGTQNQSPPAPGGHMFPKPQPGSKAGTSF